MWVRCCSLFPSKHPLLWQGPDFPPHFFKWLLRLLMLSRKHLSCFFQMNIYRWWFSPSQGRVLITLGDSRACLEGILGGEEEQTQRTNMKCNQKFFWNGRVKNPSSKGQRKGKKEKSWWWKMRSCLSGKMWMCDARVGQFSLQSLCFPWAGLTLEICKRKVTYCLFPVLEKMEWEDRADFAPVMLQE